MISRIRDDTVNFWYLNATFGILEACVGDPAWCALDANSECSMKTAYVQFVVPWVAELPATNRAVLKRTLAYFLSREFDFDGCILAKIQDLDITEPADPRALFVWLWESLYPGEHPESVDLTGLREDNDVTFMNDFQGVTLR